MALRDQPYLPLYVQDFLTDEKLNECSASATGVYIKIMCLMHKTEQYGMILLKQKDKQTTSKIKNFALKFAKLLPFSFDTILSGLEELVEEKVLQIQGDLLVQKRMVDDNIISVIRSKPGSKGGKVAQQNRQAKAQANVQANTEYEYETNTNGNEGVLGGGKDEWNKMPGPECGSLELPEIKAGAALQLSTLSGNKPTMENIYDLWGVFKTQNLTGTKFYNSQNDVFSHFINWSKTQKINGSNQQSTGNGSGKLGTSAGRIKKAREW